MERPGQGQRGRVVPRDAIRYVALGDSYTVGTAIEPTERFPDQLVAAVEASAPGTIRLVANLGVDGYTTADLIRDELPQLKGLDPGFVTLLIGVNDVVQGVNPAVYDANVRVILERLLRRLPADQIVTLSIPDYTVTPAGADYGDPAERSAAIRAANGVMAARAAMLGVGWVDIHDLSLAAAHDRSLLASDGLHPSGSQYARWVERLAPAVLARLVG